MDYTFWFPEPEWIFLLMLFCYAAKDPPVPSSQVNAVLSIKLDLFKVDKYSSELQP